MRWRDEDGQASVELTALLPLLAVVAVACWQAVVAGQAMWLSGAAARAAARAAAIGGDPLPAARAVLPPGLRRGVTVVRLDDGRGLRVRVAIPGVIGGLRLGRVGASASFPEQGS